MEFEIIETLECTRVEYDTESYIKIGCDWYLFDGDVLEREFTLHHELNQLLNEI